MSADDLLRHLVERRAEKMFRVPSDLASRGRRARAEPVCGGIADVIATASRPCSAMIGGRRRAISANASSQVAGAKVPSALLEHRRPQPVGIFVQLPDRDALRAQEAVREDVVGVAADLDVLVILERELEPTGRLARADRAEGGAVHTTDHTLRTRPAS